jgi:hypothetical protein
MTNETLKVDNGSSGLQRVNVAFPSNSHRSKEVEVKKVQKIIKGRVVQRKKSLGKRFLETFVGEDVNNVTSYLLYDVLIPAAKDTISDLVKGGIEKLLFGEVRGGRSKGGNGSRVNYGGMSNASYQRDDRRNISPINRARHNFDEIVLGSREEASEVINHLVDLIIDYGQATVSDLYDLVGITGSFTDNKWGWVDLRSASISRARDGYLLNLPRPITLN